MERVWQHRRFSGSPRLAQSNCGGRGAEGLGLLAVQGRRVVWYSEGGGRVVKQFTCECDVLEASFCTFSKGQGEGEGAGVDDGSRETAVCILLTPLHLRLHMNSGTNHDIQLPRAMEHMFAFSWGLLFQSERSTDSLKEVIEDASVPTLYTLLHPYAPVCPIATPAMEGLYESTDLHLHQGCDLFSNPQERVVGVHDGIVCTLRAEGPASGANGSAQTTAHLTLWSLIPVPQQAPASPGMGAAPPAQHEVAAAAAASAADREMGLYFPFPASMANPPSAPSSSSRGRGSPGLLGSAASSPIMMDIVGGGGSAPGSGSLPGSGGRGGFKSISVFGGATNSGGSGKRKSPSIAMMLSEGVTGGGGSPVQRRESPLSMLGGSGGAGSMPPLPPRQHQQQQRQESPAPTLAALLGMDPSSGAQAVRERDLPRPGPIKASGSVNSVSGGATAASSTGSAGKRPASPDLSKRSSPPWALRGLQVGGQGPLSQGGGDRMNLSHSGSIDSPVSPPQQQQQQQQQNMRTESVFDDSPTEAQHPQVGPAPAQSSKRSFFSTSPDFFLRLLDVATLVLKAAPEDEPASSLTSQVQVLFTGGKDSLGGVLCHVLHGASGSYRCFSVEVDGRVGCFGLSAETSPGGEEGAHAHFLGLPSANTIHRAALRAMPSLSAEGVQSLAHASQPLEGIEGVSLPLTLLQSSAGQDFLLQLGSERVASTHLSIEDDLAEAGQREGVCAADLQLSTRGRGDGPQLLATFRGDSLLLSLGPTFDRAAGRPDVLLAMLSAPQPSGAFSDDACNSVNGLTVGVTLLAGRLYGPACGVLYVLLAALGLSFPPLPPPALTDARASVALPPARRALQEQELAGCFSRLSQVCAAADASLPPDAPGVGALLFDAVHAAWQNLRLQVSANPNPNPNPYLTDEAALLAAALALAASASASRAGSAAAVQAAARRYVQYYFERGCNSHGHQSWACPAVVSSLDGSASASIRPFTRHVDVFCVSEWIGESLARVCDPSSVLVPAPLPGRKHGGRSLGLYPCPALRLVEGFLLLLRASYSAAADMSPLWWARAVVGAFMQAAGGSSAAVDSLSAPLGALDLLPTALRSLVNLALLRCREDPCSTWPAAVLKRIGREDVSAMMSAVLSGGAPASDPAVTALRVAQESRARDSQTASASKGQELARLQSDGLVETEAASVLRFAEDERVHEVCRILCSSKKIYLRVDKAPETTDLDHRIRLQTRLLTLCRRTLALCVGRGMLTIRTLEPLMAESLPIPPVVLSGRVAPSNSVIQLDTLSVPAELTLWPEFHNGVAAGLRVGTNLGASLNGNIRLGGARQRVTRNWILYNRTASAANDNGVVSHAGLLLALGLQGHLSVLSSADVCDYLTQGHEPTTIAVLIGMAAARRGTADSRTSKTLCLHLPALLPPRHWDIEISPLVQMASLVGLGLLHAGSGHRLMAEFLLAELSRKPTSDRCDTREALSLAAAWALGVVLLGKGCKEASGSGVGAANQHTTNHAQPASSSASTSTAGAAASGAREGIDGGRGGGGGGGGGLAGLSDLHIEDRLHLHISGGRRPPDSHLFPSTPQGDSNSRSSRVLEGSDVNTDVTGPGATLALALIYLGSNNADIAARIALPQTAFALDAIRPDLLLYRALGRCLIMWGGVQLTDAWFDEGIPAPLRRALKLPVSGGQGVAASARVSGAAMCPKVALLAYVCVTAGYCQGIGLVYAGTADPRAKALLLSRLRRLQSLRDNRPSFALPFAMDKSLRPIIDMSVAAAATALGCVMAGTGDLDCLRVFRELRFRVEDVTYGTHMALGMAVGFLFLAGGNASLKRDKLSIACLLLSIIPRFPAKATDNQYHLQALRHLYVVAVEERVLRTVDVSTGAAVSVGVEVLRTDGTVQQARAPCLLPDLGTVVAVRVSGEAEGGTQEFFSTSVNIAASASASASVSGGQAQVVPTLVVKRRPQASSSSSSSSSSEEKGEDRGEEAAQMALLLSAMRGGSEVEMAVSAGLEACGPLLGIVLDNV